MSGPDFLGRTNMTPGSARAVVSVTVSVEVGSWGPGCTIDQAVGQAVEGARGRLQELLGGDKSITVLGASMTRVVIDAEAKR